MNPVFKASSTKIDLLRSATVIGPEELDALLNDLEVHRGSKWNAATGASFMLECLAAIQHCLPPVALEGFAVAQTYWAGRGSTEMVTSMRVRCWQALPGSISMNIDNPRVSAIRAVICVLYPSLDANEILDLLGFFLSLVNRIEPHYQEQYLLLRKQFGIAEGPRS